jgi:hypothetical protein
MLLQTLNVGCLMILIFFAIIVILILVLTVIKLDNNKSHDGEIKRALIKIKAHNI